MASQHNPAGTSQPIYGMEDLIPAVFRQHLNQGVEPNDGFFIEPLEDPRFQSAD
jgi:hypothetical protein